MHTVKKVLIGLEAVLCVASIAILRSWFPHWAFDGAVILFALLVGWLMGKQKKEQGQGREGHARLKVKYLLMLLAVPTAAAVIVYCLKVLELINPA